MEKKVEAYIRKYHMLEQGSRVIAAVSGGADSVCLFHLLVFFRRQFNLELRVVHVHHGLRGEEADRDAEFVRELSKKWEVPCLVVYRNAALYAKERRVSVEEAGREVRYQAFYEESERWQGAKIAVAHHQEDQAETILHNLFRGSGLKGLGGMAPVRNKIIRPLLCICRSEILDYLKKNQLNWCQDSTNASMDYTRNKLRHKILPAISQEVNTKAVVHIVEAGDKMRLAEEYFEKEAGRLWKQYGVRQSEDGYRRCGIRTEAFSAIPDILKGYVAMAMIRELTNSLKDIGAVHIKKIVDLAGKGTGRSSDLVYGMRAYQEYGMLWIEKGQKLKKKQLEMKSQHSSVIMESFPYTVLKEKYQKIPEKKYTKWFDYDRIKGTLCVRTREVGDYFTLKGEKKKTIKAFMIDEKIPREERDQILLLAEGHHVLWIIGYRISESYKVTDKTKQILQVRMDGGEHER